MNKRFVSHLVPTAHRAKKLNTFMSDQNCYLNPSHLYVIAVNIVDFLK